MNMRNNLFMAMRASHLRLLKIFSVLVAVSAIISCATTGRSVHGEQELIRTIREASDYLNHFPLIERGSTIVVFSAHRRHHGLSDYIINRISRNAINDRTFTVADRTNQHLIDAERNFQMSGHVSEESMQRVGRQVGASIIMIVDISSIGNRFDFDLKVLHIESGTFQGHETYPIHNKTVA
jgi:hypothetical protein